MPRFFVEGFHFQLPKRGHKHSGDIIKICRHAGGTFAVLADGMGSGVAANVGASVVCEYLARLVEGGTPGVAAMEAGLRTLRRARLTGNPWAALSVASIGANGQAELFSYESPPALLLAASGPEELAFSPEYWEAEIVHRANAQLRSGEAILLVSDGVTHAGMERGLPRGWGIEGVMKFVRTETSDRTGQVSRVPSALVHQAYALNHRQANDDMTALVLVLRKPRVLNILSGPPARPSDDARVAKAFMDAEGRKAVCGGTTTRILAKFLGVSPTVHPGEFGCPSHYDVPGLDLASEGAITLNRLNNIFLQPELADRAGHGPSRLLQLLSDADEIHFWVGQAANPRQHDVLKPAGLLDRNEVILALADKLRQAGKFVTIHRY
jgi:hypothetical protein